MNFLSLPRAILVSNPIVTGLNTGAPEVFWTARHEVVAASSVHWPDESWSQLSPAVRATERSNRWYIKYTDIIDIS